MQAAEVWLHLSQHCATKGPQQSLATVAWMRFGFGLVLPIICLSHMMTAVSKKDIAVKC